MKIMNLLCVAVTAMLVVSGCSPVDNPDKGGTEQVKPDNGKDEGGEENGGNENNGNENGGNENGGGENTGNENGGNENGGEESGTTAVADVSGLADGTEVTVKGLIMARYGRGFMISDGKDNLLIYENNNTSSHPVGSQVTVTGAKATYGGQPQIQNVKSLEVTGAAEVKYPEPKVYAGSDMAGLKNLKTPTFIQYSGKLNISGNYYNVAIDGAEIQGSIAYPDSGLAAELSPMNGKGITVTGYHIGMTGSDKYASTMATFVVADGQDEPDQPDQPEEKVTGWIELPAKGNVSTAKEYTFYAGERNYTAYYDTKTYSSLWVAYPLAKGHTGSIKRPEGWSFAPGIPEEDQVDLTRRSYLAGHSRGHQIPNADRNGIKEMQLQTFYVINSTPQIQDGFNGDIWATLEDQVRGAIPSNDTLYVVTGPVYQTVGGSEHIDYTMAKDDDKQIPIANYFFKAVMKVKRSGEHITDAKAVGFWFEHKAYSDKKFEACAVSVDEIEKKTGYDFFANLPDSIENSAEQNDSWTTFKNF